MEVLVVGARKRRRYKHVDWKPSPVVALAASIDGTAIAAGRGNGSIEIWSVSPGSVGWHCVVTIPGKKGASLSCLLWCPSRGTRRGRLFSAGLDGFITEWDLSTLQTKEVLKSYGGSVWQMALEPSPTFTGPEGVSGSHSPEQSSSLSTDSNSDSDDGENVSGSNDEQGELKVAVGCDDGCVRLFTANDGESFVFKKSFPRVQGRILSVAWSRDAGRIVSGGSDGCIRCWDVRQLRELYRITAGQGGASNGASLCIWSILTLWDGTIVSGDSSGSTQFWDGKQGTLLQAHRGHTADVLALAAAPSHRSVFAAGADGLVVQYQLVSESRVLADATREGDLDVGIGLGARWVFVGSKRTHTHDVNALVVASPPVSEHSVDLDNKSKLVKERKKLKRSWVEQDQAKSGQSGVISMLVSGGNDAKLFTYPANAFLAFHPHDVCFAPQRTPITLALGSKSQSGLIMMAQHEHQVELWKITINSVSRQPSSPPSVATQNALSPPLSKRKLHESTGQESRKRMANGHVKKDKAGMGRLSNGPSNESPVPNPLSHTGKVKGSPPELLARIKCKSVENITCSAISDTGQFVAISDQMQPRLYELEQRCTAGTNGAGTWIIKKRRLPQDIPPAHSMVFCGSSRLLLATRGNAVWVVDIVNATTLHQFVVERDSLQQHVDRLSPLTSMCASADQQWLATADSRGNVSVFNLETFRLHWNVPPLDGNYVTATCFHPRNSDILLVTTNSNILYMLHVSMRKLGEWSKDNSHKLPRSFLEFPGGVQGLSVCPSEKGTMAVAYSSKAMCLIDFQKPVPEDKSSAVPDLKKGHLSNGRDSVSSKRAVLQNGGNHPSDKNFVLVPFKDPVLFAGYVSDNSFLVLEKPWLEAVGQLPPPVYRHLYGT
ncbi:hypothetical protein GOP47_0028244 [Adiantum capillus-veneris]|nr:hypothetical protein GOP47_0028244 [Adiantum capillus-veneris]